MAIDQLFDEFHALEFPELRVLFLAAIERQTDFPRPAENRIVFDCSFVIDVIGIDERVALDNVRVLAREIPRPVKPALTVQSGDVHNQCIFLPAAVRCPHPHID